MIQRIKGNLIDLAMTGHFDIIVHGCNCQNVMGSGIAAQIKEEWPVAFKADCAATDLWRTPIAKLGNFSYAVTRNGMIIINAYTQLHYLPRGVDHFEYEAFQLILRKVAAIDTKNNLRFGFPYIGMGLAGGDPKRIIPMIEKFGEDRDVTLVEYVK